MSDLTVTLLIERLKYDLAESKQKSLERFAASLIAAERERCAKVCEDMQRKKDDLFDGKWKTSGTTEIDGSNFAAAIRKGE